MLCDSFDVGGPQLEKLMSLLNTNKDLAFFEMKLLLFCYFCGPGDCVAK